MPVFSRVFPILYPLLLSHLVFSLLEAKEKVCAQDCNGSMKIQSSSCNMVFMIFVWSSFQTLSRRFVGFNNASVFCLASIRSATSFPVRYSIGHARHCCWHRNFQLSPRVLKNFSKLLIRWINEEIPRNLLALSSFGFSIAHFFLSLLCF